MPILSLFDGNFMVHRAFSTAAKHRNPDTIDKNTVSNALSSMCKLALEQHATHMLVCFDGPNSFRKLIDKNYKANRQKGDSTILIDGEGKEIEVPWTVGKLIKPMKEVLDKAGITYSHKKSYEADDLMNCAAKSAAEQGFACIINTRDKDIARCVSDEKRISLYWPIEKIRIREKEVIKHFGVKPRQITDYLAIIGDNVDNIQGLDGWGPAKAAKYLKTYGSLKKGLLDPEGSKVFTSKQKARLKMAKLLVTMKDDQHYDMNDCIIQPFDDDLGDFVWKIPDALKALGDTRKAATIKGLFGRR